MGWPLHLRHLKLQAWAATLLLAAGPARADDLTKKLTVATWNLEWFFDPYTGDNSADLAKKQAPPSREEWEFGVGGCREFLVLSTRY